MTSARTRRREQPPIGELSVYDGQIFRGVITRRAGRFVARDAEGREIGRFETLRDAMRALPATEIKS